MLKLNNSCTIFLEWKMEVQLSIYDYLKKMI